MKKLIFIFLALLSLSTYGQAVYDEGIQITGGQPTVTTTPFITSTASDGLQTKILGQNIPIPQIPLNYSVLTPTLGGHINGIDAKLGALTGTTAGISTRVWFTADQTTITAGTFDLTNPLNKGTVASHIQTVANDDGQKKYFTTDLIGQPFTQATTFPQGLYAGNLSVSTTPTNANQKFTVELYRCNNAGTPIASGVTGAVVGDLGVTVIMILDSGEVTLANASVTNVPVAATLGTSGFNIGVGERIRYHVSAAKAGTAGAVINESVYYGSSYNSFLDVPVIYNSSSIKDVSTVTNGAGTVTDALNSLKSSIPVNYSKIVYVDNVNPNAATIFDDVNPPEFNDDALKADVTNLYVGTDASGWVYNVSTVNYVTKSTPSVSSVWYNASTTISANNTTAPIYRTGNTGFGVDNPAQAKVVVGGIGNVLALKGADAGQTIYQTWYNPSATRRGYFGYATGGSPNISMVNEETGGHIIFNTTGTGKIGINTGSPTSTLSVNGSVSANSIDTNTTKITITTSTSITTATTDANGIRQDGRHVVIDNGVNVINLTCNGGVTTSYGKVGTGAITFVQGSGRTLVLLSGTAVFNGIAGSTATLWSNGTTDYLSINNY